MTANVSIKLVTGCIKLFDDLKICIMFKCIDGHSPVTGYLAEPKTYKFISTGLSYVLGPKGGFQDDTIILCT